MTLDTTARNAGLGFTSVQLQQYDSASTTARSASRVWELKP